MIHGKIEGNTVFTYLDVFIKEDSFKKYLPEYNSLDDLKQHYKKGGLGDVKIKRFLANVLNDEISCYREKRKELEKHIPALKKQLELSSQEARKIVQEKAREIRRAIGIDYFK